MPENVTYGRGGMRYIKSFDTPVLLEHQVSEIVEKITLQRLVPGFKTNREHVAHINDIVATKTLGKSDAQMCSKCGSAMVKRTAKRGQNSGQEFWGCSTFPKCRNNIN